MGQNELARLIYEFGREAGQRYGVQIHRLALALLTAPSPKDPKADEYLKNVSQGVDEQALKNAVFAIIQRAAQSFEPKDGSGPIYQPVVGKARILNAKDESDCHYLWFC